MVHPEGAWLFCQAVPDSVLQYPDQPLYPPIGFATDNDYMVMYGL